VSDGDDVCVCACVDTSLILSDVTQSAAGVYQCIANNVLGSVYAAAVLTVNTLPTNTSQSVPSPLPSCMCNNTI